MNIIFFISALRNGGAERVLQVLSSEFSKKHSVEVVYFEEDKKHYEFLVKTTHLNIYHNTTILSKFKKFFTIRNFIKSKKPDLIISFMDQTNINLIISTMFMSRTLIITEHVSHTLLKSKIWRFIRDFSYRFASGLTVLTKEDFEYYKFVKNRAIMHNPIFHKPKNTKYYKESIILSVGRLETVKGYENYFKALSLIDKNILDKWDIIIAGNGSLENSLKNLAINLNLKINFVGHQKDIGSLYERAKILALPSMNEGFGNVLIEALFYECARVSTPTSGAKELIKDGFDGLISEDFSAESYAITLEKLLKNDGMCQNLVQNANLKKSKFEIENIIDKWYKFIKECEQ
ncbi:glycosyltransferase [Campylobacter fetus]|uniref:GalNAc-alpha-(1,4)-GalNAc-alpha-(1, 3)-diNAcBac-PP-undecaprenol alpha-1,4-N-acetyl-D-galactosaminyltransferase n=8 Tax=Campylobacter fetus TaxID=196 RepID=A0AAE6IZK6_CAMFE|nr:MULTISPECIES: glycosyltransferase [Campylobacter]ABK83035.1 general glycosylation pathway protein [Campylobacter fetus subsp. fetus 82-40]AHE94711.1 GalNAc-alpha-(1,4)-GalNAc-alpha-(1,3)-diNAcBac-PP-undecaprenol alpha-1,4-N-acetyl-D-galactosaminyltransferase [Campylobacter fetus subsp. venerealis cfvi03/293]AIR79273.1 GalNAc-alpha-(1,4)-GalNAc-alpha-(1,3)-diNAcBac-PP-undecaprenol alpha-1,4-N-acetyl-D-galactosaminyltransferase [Campylobacter fetus subsp. fetus 04/554]AIR81125.1 GalNAc-alpha-(